MSKTVVQAVVVEHREIGCHVKEMTFHAPAIASQAVCGQFVHMKIAAGTAVDPLLRRPISIAGVDRHAGTVRIIYRIAGRGTALLASLEKGNIVDCMGPLGRGFDLSCQRPLLVGGGIGLAPLVFLASSLCPKPMEVLMGGRTKEEMFWPELFAGLCQNIHVTTDDGSLGTQGFTVDILPELIRRGGYDRIYTCGPEPMMKGVASIAAALSVPCQVSLEEHMACGVGACLSCTCAGQDGKRRKICSDGPVFWAEEVLA